MLLRERVYWAIAQKRLWYIRQRLYTLQYDLSSWLNELSPSGEAVSRSATEDFTQIFWNPKLYYRVHKTLPLVPIQNQINPDNNPNLCL
jgi:hypothetical protein